MTSGHLRACSARRSSFARAVVLGVCAAWVVFCAVRPAAAQSTPRCDAKAKAWLAECAGASTLAVTSAECPPGGVVLGLTTADGHPLRVEVARATPGSFKVAGELGLSPVGEFPDWSKEPASKQRALDALVACAEANPTLVLPAGKLEPRRAVPRTAPLPWLLFVAAAAFVSAWVPRLRASPRPLKWAKRSALAVGLVAAIFASRDALFSTGFFHMNGQGPLWIDMAALGREMGTSYGPGYAELFNVTTRVGSAPAAVLAANAVISALAAASCWWLVRGVGAPKPVAAGMCVVVVLDPVASRVAQSESYYGAGASLLMLAAAAVACGSRRATVRSGTFWLSTLAAGCLISQVARVHPVLWVPAAFVPGVVLVARGRLVSRLKLAALCAAGIAVVVVVTSGQAMVDVLRGTLGQQWLPTAHPEASLALDAMTSWRASTPIAAAVLAAILLRRVRPLVPVAVFSVGLAIVVATNLIAAHNIWSQLAYGRLLTPVVIACAAACTMRLAPGRGSVAAAVIATLLIGTSIAPDFAIRGWHPVDQREARWAMQWHESLPKGSTVAYLSRAGLRVTVLPLDPVSGVFAMPLDADAPIPDLASLSGRVFYYRSSLCSSADGKPACDAFERRYRLETVEERTWPAVESVPYLPYDSDSVTVRLSRIAADEPRD